MLKELVPLVDMLTMTRQRLRDSIQGLTVDQLKRQMPHSDWSIKDVLAHLAGNEALMTEALASIASGSQLSEREFDNEAENRAQVEKGRVETLKQLWLDLDASRARLMALLDGLTPPQLERRGMHPYQGELNVREFLVIIYSHEETHTREVVEWARQLRLGAG